VLLTSGITAVISALIWSSFWGWFQFNHSRLYKCRIMNVLISAISFIMLSLFLSSIKTQTPNSLLASFYLLFLSLVLTVLLYSGKNMELEVRKTQV